MAHTTNNTFTFTFPNTEAGLALALEHTLSLRHAGHATQLIEETMSGEL